MRTRIASAHQVRELDRRAIEDLGLPGIALMEVASRAVAVAVLTHHLTEAQAGVVVVCGGGNNGGDGYAIARWLHGAGLPVRTWSTHPNSRGDAAVMRQVCATLGIPETDGLGGAGLVVDAVLGTGFTPPLDAGRAPAVARALEAMAGHPAVVAVDLPSGLDADRGVADPRTPRCVRTVTLARLKPGLLVGEGLARAGALELADIGLDAVPGASDLALATVLDDPMADWPRRDVGDHKTRSGHLLVLAGSTAMAGAAVLCCRGALAAGAGLVSLAAPRGALPRLAALPPEVMVQVSGDGDVLAPPDSAWLDRGTALVAGPGLGGGQPLPPHLADWLTALWRHETRPVLFDADALVCVSGRGAGERVCTPHPGEAARLLGTSIAEVQQDRVGSVRALAAHGTALLKGPWTLVCDGDEVTANPTGNPVLATGGSGDVLAGIIGALLARGVPSSQAARLGAWVHGLAADRLAAQGDRGWTASDVAARVSEVLRR